MRWGLRASWGVGRFSDLIQNLPLGGFVASDRSPDGILLGGRGRIPIDGRMVTRHIIPTPIGHLETKAVGRLLLD